MNNGSDIGKFVGNVLPAIQEKMKQEYNWPRAPRTVVHDKASYFVAPRLSVELKMVADVAGSGGWAHDGERDALAPYVFFHEGPQSPSISGYRAMFLV